MNAKSAKSDKQPLDLVGVIKSAIALYEEVLRRRNPKETVRKGHRYKANLCKVNQWPRSSKRLVLCWGWQVVEERKRYLTLDERAEFKGQRATSEQTMAKVPQGGLGSFSSDFYSFNFYCIPIIFIYNIILIIFN